MILKLHATTLVHSFESLKTSRNLKIPLFSLYDKTQRKKNQHISTNILFFTVAISPYLL